MYKCTNKYRFWNSKGSHSPDKECFPNQTAFIAVWKFAEFEKFQSIDIADDLPADEGQETDG